MDELQKQVGRARRRLAVQRFVEALGWCCLATLGVALVGILVGKWWPLGVPDVAWLGGGLGLGLLAAAGWALFSGGGSVDAAIEIDRRFGLKERISSTLALSEEERQSEVGRALLEDALRRVRRIEVRERMPIAPRRSLWLPLIPAVLALVVALGVSPAVVDNPAQAKADPAAVKKQVKKSTQALRRQLAQRRKQAQQRGLKDAERLFKRLEEGTKDLGDKSKGNRKKALVKLNDLAKELKKRRGQLGGADQVKQQLAQMKNLDRGPADKFAKAVGRGDFRQALEELEKLRQQIADGKLDEKKRKELAKQLDQMREKLQKMQEAHEQAQKDLEKRIDAARKNGDEAKANQLQEQLEKLQQQCPQMDQLGQMAQQMEKCSQCLKQGQMEDAAEAMDQLQAGLEGMKQQLDEMEMLDEALDQMCQARDQMNCQQCGGLGCEACQGKPGFGLGEGRGQGDRPEEKTDTAFRDSRVKQKVGRGTASVVDLVEGPNVKGNVGQEIQAQYESAQQGATDPLTDQQMPREHRQHAREYFNRFREGK